MNRQINTYENIYRVVKAPDDAKLLLGSKYKFRADTTEFVRVT